MYLFHYCLLGSLFLGNVGPLKYVPSFLPECRCFLPLPAPTIAHPHAVFPPMRHWQYPRSGFVEKFTFSFLSTFLLPSPTPTPQKTVLLKDRSVVNSPLSIFLFLSLTTIIDQSPPTALSSPLYLLGCVNPPKPPQAPSHAAFQSLPPSMPPPSPPL